MTKSSYVSNVCFHGLLNAMSLLLLAATRRFDLDFSVNTQFDRLLKSLYHFSGISSSTCTCQQTRRTSNLRPISSGNCPNIGLNGYHINIQCDFPPMFRGSDKSELHFLSSVTLHFVRCVELHALRLLSALGLSGFPLELEYYTLTELSYGDYYTCGLEWFKVSEPKDARGCNCIDMTVENLAATINSHGPRLDIGRYIPIYQAKIAWSQHCSDWSGSTHFLSALREREVSGRMFRPVHYQDPDVFASECYGGIGIEELPEWVCYSSDLRAIQYLFESCVTVED